MIKFLRKRQELKRDKKLKLEEMKMSIKKLRKAKRTPNDIFDHKKKSGVSVTNTHRDRNKTSLSVERIAYSTNRQAFISIADGNVRDDSRQILESVGELSDDEENEKLNEEIREFIIQSQLSLSNS
jgi:ribosomal protein L2